MQVSHLWVVVGVDEVDMVGQPADTKGQDHKSKHLDNFLFVLSRPEHCTLYIAHCTLRIAHSTLHTAHYTLDTEYCKLHTAHCILNMTLYI